MEMTARRCPLSRALSSHWDGLLLPTSEVIFLPNTLPMGSLMHTTHILILSENIPTNQMTTIDKAKAKIQKDFASACLSSIESAMVVATETQLKY